MMLSRCILSLVFLSCPLSELSYTITRFPEFFWSYFHDTSFLSCCIIIWFTVILSCCLYNVITLCINFGFSLLSIIGIILYYHEIPCCHLIILSKYFFLGLSSLTRFIVVLSCCLCILSRCLLLELYYTITRFLFYCTCYCYVYISI